MSLEKVARRQEGSVWFDLFELDAKSGQLRRSGVTVDLPPQVLRILQLLTARPHELVTRKEFKDALWPGQSYGDFDSRLNFTIKKLREALGDDAERPRYVKTVRNAGYTFIAPVRIQSLGQRLAVSSVPPNQGAPINDELYSNGEITVKTGAWNSGTQRIHDGISPALTVAVFVFMAIVFAALLLSRQGAAGNAKAFFRECGAKRICGHRLRAAGCFHLGDFTGRQTEDSCRG